MNILKIIANILGVGSNKKVRANQLDSSNINNRPPNTFSVRVGKSPLPASKYYNNIHNDNSGKSNVDKVEVQPEDKIETPAVNSFETTIENRTKHYRQEIDNMSEHEVKTLIASLAEEDFTDINDNDLNTLDPMFDEAARLIVIHQQGSTSLIQRKLKLGYDRAGRLIDQLEAARIVSPFEGIKSRDVLISDLGELEFRLKYLKNNILIYKPKSDFDVVKNSIFYEKYKNDIEKKKIENMLEHEKEVIREELIEKNRKRQLRREVLRQLKDEGIINNLTTNERKREPIPQDVMDMVWNRDSGRCVKCGSQENLEFDHIIPFSKGGSNTYKNLQILCKTCNIEKSNKIG